MASYREIRNMALWERREAERKHAEQNPVIRYVPTYVNKDGMRTLMLPAQGRHTYATREDALSWLKAVTENNSPETIKQTWGEHPLFQVRECKCWAGHFDPMGVYFD